MEINIQKNRNYYNSENLELCDCDYCKNYYKKIKNAYPKVSKYLETMGIDIEKPFELNYLEPLNGKLEYIFCEYIVFGSIEENYNYKIEDVSFRKSDTHPITNIKEEHFVLGFGPIYLPI